jgi:hypothetical protein
VLTAARRRLLERGHQRSPGYSKWEASLGGMLGLADDPHMMPQGVIKGTMPYLGISLPH